MLHSPGGTTVTPLRADFLMVRPVDIGHVGALGAAILALIRYATSRSDEANGRLILDGTIWWRASHPELGRGVGGVSHDSVRREVGKLCRAGLLQAIPADAFPGDRAMAYRVVDQPLRISAPGDDQPLREIASPSREITSPMTRNRVTHHAESRDAPISVELKEVGEDRPPVPMPPRPPTCGPFGPRCRKHAAVENPPACWDCKTASDDHKAALAVYEAEENARRAAVVAAIDNCPDPYCDQHGRLLDLSDCPRHPNLRNSNQGNVSA